MKHLFCFSLILLMCSCDIAYNYMIYNDSNERVYFVEHFLSETENFDHQLHSCQVYPHECLPSRTGISRHIVIKGRVMKVYIVDAKAEDVPDLLTFDQLQSCYWHRVIGTITVTDKQNDILLDYGLSYPANECFPIEYNDAYGQE